MLSDIGCVYWLWGLELMRTGRLPASELWLQQEGVGGEEERGVAMRLEDSYLQNIAYLKCLRVVILLTTAATVFRSAGMRSTVKDL